MNVLKFSPRSILCRSNIAGFQTQSFFNTKIVIPKSVVTFSNPTIYFRRLYSVDPKSVDPMDDYELKIFTILNENLDPDQLTVTDVSGMLIPSLRYSLTFFFSSLLFFFDSHIHCRRLKVCQITNHYEYRRLWINVCH